MNRLPPKRPRLRLDLPLTRSWLSRFCDATAGDTKTAAGGRGFRSTPNRACSSRCAPVAIIRLITHHKHAERRIGFPYRRFSQQVQLAPA
jgi:hypothetical protein